MSAFARRAVVVPLVALKASVRALDRVPGFHAPALALVQRLNRRTARELARHPAVAAVYFKGSFVRGPFRPFASDVDLALVLRDEALAPATLTDLCRTLRRLRWRNPSVRDWWQHLIAESELPLVERYWPLFGADEWRDAAGAPAPLALRPAGRSELRLLAWATWLQQCAWSASAVQVAIDPAAPFHDFGAGVRKASFFAARLRAVLDAAPPLGPAELFDLRRRAAHALERTPAPSRERAVALAAMVAELEASARRLGAPPVEPLGPGGDPLPGAPACRALLLSDRTLHAVVAAGANAGDVAAIVAALRRAEAPRRPLGFFVPETARALWPRPATAAPLEARGATSADLGAAAPERELLLFDALFLPSSLRLALGFPDAPARLRRLLGAAGRAWLLYRHGRPAAEGGAIAAALEAAGSPAAAALLAGEAAGAERLFRAADDLARDLGAALLAAEWPARET